MSISDVTSCGEMRVVSSSESGVAFVWTPIFNSLSDYRKEHCTSPEIRVKGSVWFFKLYPKDYSVHNNKDRFVLSLYRLGSMERDVRFAIGYKLAGEMQQEIVSTRLFPQRSSAFRFLFLLPRSKVLKSRCNLNLTGQLTIICQLWTDEQPALEGETLFTPEATTADSLAVRSAKEEERYHLFPERCSPSQSDRKLIGKEFVSRETQMEEQSDITASEDNGANLETKVDSTLQKHLKDFLHSGDDHDVTIKVGDQEFRAHKGILRARSPVFAAMFKHEMKESEDGTITIDDCDPEAFGDFLNYVYTGKVEDLTPRKATGLYFAGDKYDFSGLKKLCVQFLKSSLSTTSICDVINLATTHSEKGLLESAIKFFSENTKEILITVEWQRFAAKNFVAANELFLKAIDAIENKK